MKILFAVLLFTLLSPVTLAQRGRSRGHSEPRGIHNGGGHFDRAHHARIDRVHDVRVIGGRQEVFFGGLWFDCDIWPDWIWTDDVYVIVDADGDYVLYSYDNPALSIGVTVAF